MAPILAKRSDPSITGKALGIVLAIVIALIALWYIYTYAERGEDHSSDNLRRCKRGHRCQHRHSRHRPTRSLHPMPARSRSARLPRTGHWRSDSLRPAHPRRVRTHIDSCAGNVEHLQNERVDDTTRALLYGNGPEKWKLSYIKAARLREPTWNDYAELYPK